jgi:multiple sugar transport system substrate-binding protein
MIKRLALLLIATLATGITLAQTVQLYHDKSGWQPQWEAVAALDDVAWDITPYADVATYQAAVRGSLRSPAAPGLFTWWSGYRMADLVNAGLVEDLSPIWQKYVDAGEVSAELAGGFTFDGKIYAVPNLVAYWVMYYNKNIYDSLGLEVPATWEQLEANLEAIRQTGVTPIGHTIEGRWPAFIWFSEFLIRTDPDFYDRLMAGEASYTDPEVETAFLLWKDWMDRGWMDDGTKAFGFTSGASINADFAAGNVAHILVGTWFAETVNAAGIEEGSEWGMFVMPNRDASLRPSVVVETGPILVAANSRNKAAALEAADFWMSATASQAWTDQQGFIPHNNLASLPSDKVVAGIAQQVADGDYRQINRFWEATPTAIAENAVDEIAKFVLDPSSYRQVMESLQQLAEREWAGQ